MLTMMAIVTIILKTFYSSGNIMLGSSKPISIIGEQKAPVDAEEKSGGPESPLPTTESSNNMQNKRNNKFMWTLNVFL